VGKHIVCIYAPPSGGAHNKQLVGGVAPEPPFRAVKFCGILHTRRKGEIPLANSRLREFTPFITDERKEVITTNKSKMFCFRLSESDYLRIHSRAEKAQLSMSAFILSTALGKEIIIVEGLDKSLSELKAIGRNLNQLTTLCNMGKIQALELAEIKRQFGAVVESVTSLKAG